MRLIGKWILQHDEVYGEYYICSICGEKALLNYEAVVYDGRVNEPEKSNYCPNCGARME